MSWSAGGTAPDASTASTASSPQDFDVSASRQADARSSASFSSSALSSSTSASRSSSAASRACCRSRRLFASAACALTRSSRPRTSDSASYSFDGPSSSIEPSSLYERNGR